MYLDTLQVFKSHVNHVLASKELTRTSLFPEAEGNKLALPK